MAHTFPSIFEILTAENPCIDAPPDAQGNTKRLSFLRPKQLTQWDDFSFPVLEKMYGGKLMEEARRRNRLFTLPFLSENSRKITDEKTTTHVITSWNFPIVTGALEAVQNSLHPSTWTADTKPTEQPRKRRRSTSPHPTPQKDASKLVPDASAWSLCEPCRIRDSQSVHETIDRLPKEYKPSFKWKSTMIPDLTDSDGFWRPGMSRRDGAWPIRQAYTYCVRRGCRYGCIMTTREIVVFRIKPSYRAAGKSTVNNRQEWIELRDVLVKEGVMEWKSIPWENHRPGDTQDYEDLTVNLSLWVIHVLAGNSHQVAWKYDSLLEESLVLQPCSPVSSHTQAPSASQENEDYAGENIEIPSSKRIREDQAEDPIETSYCYSEPLPDQPVDSAFPPEIQSSTEEDTSSEGIDQDSLHDWNKSSTVRSQPRRSIRQAMKSAVLSYDASLSLKPKP